MPIPTEFKGTLLFFWNIKYEHLSVCHHDMSGEENYLLIGTLEGVEVKFDAINDKAIESLEKQIAQEREASAARIALMQGRIESLRALEYQEAV